VSRSISLLLLARSLLSRVLRCRPVLSATVAGLVIAALAGCEKERSVAVRVSIPDADAVETPAAGVGVIALPYNRDSVLASLEARARTPRPHTAALDSLFARFRDPFTAYTRVSYVASELRDSLARLQQVLDTLPRDSPQHGSLSARIRQMSDSLTAVVSRAERAGKALGRARANFVSRSESLRAAVRQWEDSTYRGYDSIVGNLTNSRGREAATDTTGETGWAHFTLSPGRWWLYARAWDTGDPNAEWYWNVPVEDDTLLLSSRTGRRRPRY
jgi:hypothetical protein